ncbi:conserved domain protein [Ruegeria sp. TrichCH4B]|nr:conserved domain protein [Ruegeria sp. TrichCH4B]
MGYRRHDGAIAVRMKNNIQELRQIAGWSQAELAKRLNVSRQTVNALERGRYDPSLPLAFAIAQLFERQIEQVFQPDT